MLMRQALLYRERARVPRGQKIIGLDENSPGNRQLQQNADLAPFGYNGTCDTKLFNFWIKEKLLPELKQGQIVIMDNASIHNETRQLIESAGCTLIFLPPYSPDLNPIEHFWAKLKKVLRYTMHKFESFQDAILAAFSQGIFYINGVKSFRQTSYNISAGLTWRFKLGN